MPDFSAQPINYSMDVATPFASAMQGYAGGAAIRNDQQAQQQQQIAQQQQQQQYQLLSSLANNPNATGDDYARVMTAMPSLAEPLAKAWGTKNDAQQTAHVSDLLQYGSAIKQGQPQVAADMMNAKADAMERQYGQPTPESQALRTGAQVVAAHPNFAYGMISAQLAANPKAKDAATALSTFGTEARAEDLAPSTLTKNRADASTAVSESQIKGVQAGNAPTATTLDNQTKEEGILTAQAQRQVAAMNTQISQANSETERGRLTLERDKFIAEQKQQGQALGNAAQNQMDSLGTALATVNQALNHPGLAGGVVGKGGVFSDTGGIGGAGTTSGRLLDLVPGTDAHDFRAVIGTLKSQQFLTQLQALKTGAKGSTGMGALSNAEGARLESAIASLDPDQGGPQLTTALKVIQTTLEKAQQKLVADNPALPTKGGAPVATIQLPTGKAIVTDGDVNRLMAKNPGMTRQQVLEFIKAHGGAN